jgi:hypothetical protein
MFIGLETDLEEISRLRTSLKNDHPIQLSLLSYKKSGEKFWLNISVHRFMIRKFASMAVAWS